MNDGKRNNGGRALGERRQGSGRPWRRVATTLILAPLLASGLVLTVADFAIISRGEVWWKHWMLITGFGLGLGVLAVHIKRSLWPLKKPPEK